MLAYVALGSNLSSHAGSSRQTLLAAAAELRPLAAGEVRLSTLHQTAAEGCEPGAPPFMNAMAELEPLKADPHGFLRQLQELETRFGRQRQPSPDSANYASRTLDLDLISFGAAVISDSELVLPHPRAAQRQFVLAPLAELAPDLVLPGQSVSVAELLAQSERAERHQA